MLTQERKAHILDVLHRERRIIAKELSHALGLSEDTIRRDLRELAAEGLLQRVHGGALPASPAMADFAARRTIAQDGKALIGRRAAQMVQPGQIVLLDGGTTAEHLARSLAPDLRATVVTHSPSIALALVDHPEVIVDLIGGRLFKHSVVSMGAAALEALGRVRADLFFMGVTGVHPVAGLTTGDAEEAAMKRALSRQAAETVVLASSEKHGAASPYLVLALNEVDALVVDQSQPEIEAACESAGVTLIRIDDGNTPKAAQR